TTLFRSRLAARGRARPRGGAPAPAPCRRAVPRRLAFSMPAQTFPPASPARLPRHAADRTGRRRPRIRRGGPGPSARRPVRSPQVLLLPGARRPRCAGARPARPRRRRGGGHPPPPRRDWTSCRVRDVKRRAVVLASGALAISVLPAMAANLLGGAALYEDIHREFPGNGTAVLAAALRGAVDLASVVSLGAVIFVLFFHPRSAKSAGRLRSGPDLSILTWAAGAWTVL